MESPPADPDQESQPQTETQESPLGEQVEILVFTPGEDNAVIAVEVGGRRGGETSQARAPERVAAPGPQGPGPDAEPARVALGFQDRGEALWYGNELPRTSKSRADIARITATVAARRSEAASRPEPHQKSYKESQCGGRHGQDRPPRLRGEDTHDQHARRVGRPEVAPTPTQQAIQETTPRALGEAAPRTTEQTSLAPSEQGAEGETQPQVEILGEMAVAGERSPGRPGAAVWQRADPEQVAVPG